MDAGSDKTAIRNAATVVLSRQGANGPEVLMGQRGASAAFMPNKFVFPGGAVDAADMTVPLAAPLAPGCAARITQHGRADDRDGRGTAQALAAAAIRELWEETGLIVGQPGRWPNTPPVDWAQFAAEGFLPDASGLTFFFRAITPPGRPRRFDARFFLADAARVMGAADDFHRASDELSHLQWIPLSQVRRFNLPFITEVALAEVAELLAKGGAPGSVPFFDNSSDTPTFRRIA